MDLLELLKNKLPDKCGEASGWNFEKAHIIRVGFLRHYERLLSEVDGFPGEPADEYAADTQILCDRNFNVACETGIRYPSLPAMLNSNAIHLRFSVSRISLVVP